MPLWVASIIGGLVSAAGTLVGKVLISLGFGYVVFSGVDTSIEWARDFAVAQFSGLDARTVQVAGMLKIGVAISILTSAITTRLLLNGLTNGTITRLVTK